jgi:dipeptidyl aminopeptidase/acylaminoacyl peptidase
MFHRRSACACLLAAFIVPVADAQQAPPLQSFFKRPALLAPALSPDGQHLAMVVTGPDGRGVLAVAPSDAPQRRTGVARIEGADIEQVWWVNNRRLLFAIGDLKRDAPRLRWSGDFEAFHAVDLDGSDLRLRVGQGSLANEVPWSMSLAQLRRDGSDDIIVLRHNAGGSAQDAGSTTPARVDTRRASVPRLLLTDEPRHAVDWALNDQGQPLAVRSIDRDGQVTVRWRAKAGDDWQTLDRYGLFDATPGLEPLALQPDGQLLVIGRRDDAARTAAVYRYRPQTRQREAEPLAAVRDFDIDGPLIFDRTNGQLAGVGYISDARGVAWLDPRLREVQARVDALLPNTVNLFGCDPCGGQSRFVVTAWSDRQPPVYFVFDSRAEGQAALTLIGPSRPDIDASRMAAQDFHRLATRDGASMPVYVTQPPGRGPWPAVVLVHGGPWVRGVEWGWTPMAQFLASRGYLVVEPEFRGSLGHGHTWYLRSFKQWGQAMQDDLTDAARWAVAQGLADPKRIAIAGGSYGGYAALMGVLREPELFRAAVNWVGVTDLALMYTYSASDVMGSVWLRDGFPKTVGDVDTDAAMMARHSPLQRASEIRRPVLMAYGERDSRVPLVHGTRMRDALRKSEHAEVEWVSYESEGHGFVQEPNRLDFWRRVEAFLARHLK